MAISFASPWFLLLLLPAALLMVMYNGRRRYLRAARPLILFLRAGILFLLILAMAGPHLVRTFPGQSVVFLVDSSRSVEQAEDVTGWINESLGYMGSEDQAAVLAFGRDSQLLKPYGMERLPGLQSSVDNQFTAIEAALRTAYGLIPGDANGRVVLVSDGLENVGDAVRFAQTLGDLPVDVLPLSPEQGPEVAIRDISLPRNTYLDQQVIVDVELESTVNTSAQLSLFWGPNLVFADDVSVSAGVQRYSIPVTVSGQSMQRVTAAIQPEHDTWLQNNQVDGITFVQAPPRLLIVEGVRDKGFPLHDVFVNNGVDVQRISVDQFHHNLTDLASFQAVYLVDVPAYFLDEARMHALEAFVSELGGGLVAVGGKSSYGLGLYQDTPLETLLPVTMEVEEQEDLPGLDLVLVIDRSGSMSGEKLNMAKNAAVSALDILKPRDRLSVITFDNNYRVEFDLTEVTDKAALTAKIEAIQQGGGTIIHPALEQAEAMLRDSVRSKHIILLSDGVEGTQYNYEPLLEAMRDNAVSLTTIALGADADEQHMQSLAENADGRYYPVPRPGDLPGVFVQETVLAGGDYLVEEDFQPSVTHPDSRWFLETAPVLHGYVASKAKATAEVLLATHREHPLLARWQYGLGRSIAFTSDSFGLWSQQLLAHPAFADLWLDTLNWVVPARSGGDLALDVRLQDAGAEISAMTNESLGDGESIKVTMIDVENQRQVLELLPVGRGRYSVSVDYVPQGVYLLSGQRLQDDVVQAQAVSGFAVPYPPEFSISQSDGNALLHTLAETTGGRELTAARQVFNADFTPARRATDISNWLLLAAIILWPVDIAARRLGLAVTMPRRKQKRPLAEDTDSGPGQDPAMERLLKAKKRSR
ncbi:MAG: VWA domain-containing protein [Firmicutes bacterium]|nr:VWA domain-containing protein [Bacillota bacterium]